MIVSVLMSVYYKETASNLTESLQSIMNQTRLPDEVVLVKDGPLTPELEDAISETLNMSISGVSINIVPINKNVGLGKALAVGMSHCKGDLIIRMDSDDIAVSKRIEIEENFMISNPDISVVGSEIDEFITDCNEPIRKKQMPTGPEEVRQYGKFRNPINHMTACFRKADIDAVGGYLELPLLEDYYLWSRLLAAGKKLDNISQVLVHARVTEEFEHKRGGIQYYKEYRKLRRLQFEMGLTSTAEYMVAVAATAAMTLSGSGARSKLYAYLRKTG